MTFQPLGSALGDLLNEWLENPEARRVVLQRTWEQALGQKISCRCRPLGFADGTLTVEVTDSSWAPQLEAMTADLIAKVNAALGKPWVRTIDWV